MKDEMESLELTAVIRELKKLKGGYLQKVYKPGKDEILFRLYESDIGSKFLLFKVGKALFLTEREKENPKRPGDYVMLMRKYVANSTIVEIRQHEFDRVVVMELEKEKRFQLIFEVFGKGNLILTGDEQIILPYHSETWKHRELKEGVAYKFPPSRKNPMKFDEDEIGSVLKDSSRDLVRTLAVEMNLGGKYAEELCERLGVDKNTEDYDDITDQIWYEFQELKEQVLTEEFQPQTILKDEEMIDAVPFPLEIYKDMDKESKESYNEALDLAFREDEREEEEESKGKLQRKLEHQKRAIKELKEGEENDKIRAELIYQNYQEC